MSSSGGPARSENQAQIVTRLSENRVLPREQSTSVALIPAIWVIAVLHWTLKDAVVPWDSKNQFYAFFRFLAATLHSSEWPFWNPYHYGGHPSVADPQSLIFSPYSSFGAQSIIFRPCEHSTFSFKPTFSSEASR
jgi:hypothetical protein